MKLQEYLDKHNKIQSMEKEIDIWAVEYQLRKLVPLVKAGYDFQDIVDFFTVKLNDFVQNGRLDEILEEEND